MTHEYLKRLNKAHESGIIEYGRVTNVEVQHDDWCGVYSGKHCNCDPEIIASMGEGRYRILANGRAVRIAK